MSKKCTQLWREAPFEVKMYKAHHSRTTFGSCNVEKAHAVVAQSTFPSQKCGKLTVSGHFWKWACQKSARRCAAKHISTLGRWDFEKVYAGVARSKISKWKCQKHHMLGPLLKVEMWKKCTPLRREAHVEVKSVRNWWFWAFFDVQMLKKCALTNLTNLLT